MNVGFMLFESVHGKKDIGSSRIRGHWVMDKWPEAESFIYGKKYDAIIFQKAYLDKYASYFDGIKILDICDPDWLDWQPVMAMINSCHAITTSTLKLKEMIENFTDKPVVHIPDRVNLESLPPPKVHSGRAKNVVWFGYKHNLGVLNGLEHSLEKRGLELTVISNGPYEFGKWISWDEDTAHEEIQKADIAIFPEPSGVKGQYKSNNKTVLSWALGIPVAQTGEQLDALLEEAPRIEEANRCLAKVKEEYDVRLSVGQYKDLIAVLNEVQP